MAQRTQSTTGIAAWLLAITLYSAGGAAADGVIVLDAGPTPTSATEGVVSPEVMAAIRAGTFEVVLQKAVDDPLEYEKPLPLDLLPFAERSDKYRSIGTAFAIASGSFVTAAHVFAAASGSQQGIPALRDAQGNVFPVDRVQRYSQDQDFAVFTVTGAPRVTPLPASTRSRIDTPVVAVGNALGQGIVARGGTLTSETPEEQDGAWNWLRFSAPASPGNSGGPLLDSSGQVIGVIARKSANENLNYAVPIGLVLDAPANKARINQRMTVGVPFMTVTKTVKVQAEFDLPLRFADFDRRLIALNDERFESARQELLRESADKEFPYGNSSRLLADTFLTSNPALIAQQNDGSWDVPRDNGGNTVQIGNDGYVWMRAQNGAAMFRIRYPGELDVSGSRGDSRLLSRQLLQGIRLGRPVGAENVRITSLGDAGKPREFRDSLGRLWQQWFYPMPFADTTIIVSALATPEGYIGIWRSTGGAGLQ